MSERRCVDCGTALGELHPDATGDVLCRGCVDRRMAEDVAGNGGGTGQQAVLVVPPQLEFVSGNGHGSGPGDRPAVRVDRKGNLVLPEVPAPEDLDGCCAWLTAVFNLNRAHPIVRGEHQGLRGPAGHVVLHRLNADPLRFEPASRLNAPAKLIEDLAWRMLPSDGAVPGFKGEHARQITHVVRMLCGASRAASDEQETAGLVGAFLQGAVAVEGHTTYGESGARYEAARALQRDLDELTGRPLGPARYLIDRETGELAIPVGALTAHARGYIGGSLQRGWLDGRMDGLGWQRVRLDGHQLSGRAGRAGPHARVDVYRGLLPTEPDDQEGVTT
jgi:hypothetical protein